MDSEERFGYSLALVDGDLALDGGVLRTVVGRQNLLQALELRVLTPYGSDMFNTGYGLDVRQAFTQAAGLRTVKDLIRLNLVRTIGTDPRVRDIRQVLFLDDPDYLARHPQADPAALRAQRRRRAWEVEVIFEALSEESETLRVAIGG